jgi:sugar lactone lactonase YvrE
MRDKAGHTIPRMRKRWPFFLLFLSLCAATKTPQQLYEEARAAHEKKDFAAYAAAMTELRTLRPSHPTVLFNYAGALALTNRGDEAIAQLQRLASMQVAFDLSDTDLDSIRTRDDFRNVEQAMQATRTRRVANSTFAFRIPEKNLIAESIAYDPKSRAFFVSSVRKRKILRVDASGAVRDFVASEVWGVNGLGVDAKRRILYATSMAHARVEGFDKDKPPGGALFAFDLDSGKRIARYDAPKDVFVDDLTVAPDGTVYVSNSQGSVLKLADGALTTFARGMRSAQGSAFGNGLLYVADYAGAIFAVDPRTGDAAKLTLPDDFAAIGIDGLEFVDGRLLAIQNGVNPNRVVRLTLDGPLRVKSWEIVDMNREEMDEPTIGVAAKGAFYWIANSQGDRIAKGEEGKEHVVLKLR